MVGAWMEDGWAVGGGRRVDARIDGWVDEWMEDVG